MTDIKLISIKKIKPNKYHYNEYDYQKWNLLKNRLKKTGQIIPIVVRKKDSFYEIIDGNKRFKILQELDSKDVLCVDMNKVSDLKAKVLYIELNEIKFDFDVIKFAKLITSITKKIKIDKLITLLPFSKRQLTL